MSGRALPVGVVGVGHLGRHHARLYAAEPDVELVGVVDSDAERARAIAAEYDCAVLPDVAALVGRVEAVSVAVPTEAHCAVAVPLLEAGLDVLVEKPLARDMEEADRINEAADQAGRLVMVGHTERFNPAVVALAEAVHEPRFLEVHRLVSRRKRAGAGRCDRHPGVDREGGHRQRPDQARFGMRGESHFQPDLGRVAAQDSRVPATHLSVVRHRRAIRGALPARPRRSRRSPDPARQSGGSRRRAAGE